MTSPQADAHVCHVRLCGQPAEFACDRCGKPCCADHVRHLVVERRQERDSRPGMLGALTRVPTRTEAYSFCLRCSTKPVVGNPRVTQTGE
jgi:hypothetical protein